MRKKWWIPIFLIICFGIESIFSNFFPAHLFSVDMVFVPRILLVYLVFIAVFYDKKMAIIYSFVMGMVMDIVFLEIMGVYIFFYPVIVFGVTKIMTIIHNHLLILAFVSILSITVLEFGLYGFFLLLQRADFTIEQFAQNRLYPTLLLNLSFYILISYPLKKYFSVIKKLKEEEEGMFQT